MWRLMDARCQPADLITRYGAPSLSLSNLEQCPNHGHLCCNSFSLCWRRCSIRKTKQSNAEMESEDDLSIGGDGSLCPICSKGIPKLTWRGTENIRLACCGRLICHCLSTPESSSGDDGTTSIKTYLWGILKNKLRTIHRTASNQPQHTTINNLPPNQQSYAI